VQVYRIADLRLASAVPLPGVARVEHGPREWHLHVERRRLPPTPDHWYHEATADGASRPWRLIGRAGTVDVIRYRREGTFVVDRRSREIVAYPHPDLQPDALRQTLIGQLLPLVLSLSGRLVLHASAVRAPEGLIAFIGRSGAGKSTIAAALAAAGYSLATDDCVALECRQGRWYGIPFHSGVRLWRDSADLFSRDETPREGKARRKTRFSASQLGLSVHARRTPLSRLYLLHPERMSSRRAQAPRVASVPAVEAMFELVRGGFHPAVGDRRSMRRLFDGLTSLASHVEVHRLHYSQRLSALEQIVAAIMRDTGRG